MKNLSSWLIALFAFMFWAFRVIATVMATLGTEFVAPPTDMTMEIVLLFITFICICLIVKRSLLSALIYLIAHGMYYGIYLYQNIMSVINGTVDIDMYMNLFIALIGIAIPIAALFDVLLDKNRKAHPTDQKTDWFYKNKDFDRKLDDRADKNNYRTL
ncbi:MAG: hypothetical protein IJ777_04115 [Clostridia bacterium]|nr:hypothetical protein [Clostridia bacterium]